MSDLDRQLEQSNLIEIDKIKMIIIKNDYGETAINVKHIAQFSYVKSKKKQNTNYMVAEIKHPNYQMEIDLLDFIQSDNINKNTFYLEI